MEKKFKGFTLVELLGVIVLLAVIGLIVFPIVEQNIKEGRETSLSEIINNIENSGYYYSLEYDLGYSEKYKTITLQQLKEAGVLKYEDKITNPVTNKDLTGCVAYRWVNNKYEFKYVEPCSVDLAITITNRNGVFNENGWANESFWVDIDTSGTSLKYCVATNKCTPNTTVNDDQNSVYVLTEGSNYICAQAISDLGQGEVVCSEQFNLDKTVPDIAKTEIYYNGGSNNVLDLISVTAGKSGYEITCDKTDTQQLEQLTSKVTCTIDGNNGKSTTREITFYANYMKQANDGETNFLSSSIAKKQVETIKVVNDATVPSTSTSRLDISAQKNKSIMVWYVDEDSNGMYEMYIGQSGGVILENASYLFQDFTKATTIDLTYLDTSKVTSMESMFENMSSISTLDLTGLDTSRVTNMSWMFRGLTNLTTLNIDDLVTTKVTDMSYMFHSLPLASLDLSHFNTTSLTNTKSMFDSMSNLTSLNISNFDISKVTDYDNMFANIKDDATITVNDTIKNWVSERLAEVSKTATLE